MKYISVYILAIAGDCNQLNLNYIRDYNFTKDLGCWKSPDNTATDDLNSLVTPLVTGSILPIMTSSVTGDWYSSKTHADNTRLSVTPSLTVITHLLNDDTSSSTTNSYTTEIKASVANAPSDELHTTVASSSTCFCNCDDVNAFLSIDAAIKEFKTLTLDEKIEKVKKDMKIDKTVLTSSVNKKISAPDKRTSASNIGYIGISLLVTVFGGIFIMDLPAFYEQINDLKRVIFRN